MMESTRRTLGLGLGLVVAVLFVAMPVVLFAEETDAMPPGPAAVQPDSSAPRTEQVAYWRARGAAARTQLAEAESRLNEINGAVSRMRRRNHPRGEARQELRAQQAHARAMHEDAVEYLEVELPVEARAAGASTAWLRDPSQSARGGEGGRGASAQR